jgi:hypothetical protein
MIFEEVEIETFDGKQKHIIIDLGDGSFKSFPADENNPEYMAWLNPETTFVAELTEPVEESEPTEPADEPSPDTE